MCEIEGQPPPGYIRIRLRPRARNRETSCYSDSGMMETERKWRLVN